MRQARQAVRCGRLAVGRAASAARSRRRPSSEPRAIAPRPSPERRKEEPAIDLLGDLKSSTAGSLPSGSSGSTSPSFLRDRLVQVQDHAGGRGVGGQLDGSIFGSGGLSPWRISCERGLGSAR